LFKIRRPIPSSTLINSTRFHTVAVADVMAEAPASPSVSAAGPSLFGGQRKRVSVSLARGIGTA
jgi:hypothetical protein